eukprot:TRINITY_DN11580_c0_g1_i1.p1 TRINITY_DN11580_c0_g1~~TRINITY_DN11580_c0_g1_i1.p1  ORF type:complete len:437 (-),score=138.39 TRINITY_DN11580_c0_g1_i1:1042-2283(-)
MEVVLDPDHCLPVLVPGRLVRVRVASAEDWGWGVVVRLYHDPPPAGSALADKVARRPALGYLLDTLLHVAKRKEGAAEGPLRPCPKGEEGEMVVRKVSMAVLAAISPLRVKLPEDLRQLEERQKVLSSVQALEKQYKGNLPTIHPVDDLGLEDNVELRKNWEDLVLAQKQLEQHALAKEEESEEQVARFQKKAVLQARMDALAQEQRISQVSLFKSELHNRSRVLTRLGAISPEGVVQLKGRAACHITTADELLITELMFAGTFTSLDAAEVVALATCFLPKEKSNDKSEAWRKMEKLRVAFEQLRTTATAVAEVQKEEKIQIDVEEYVESFKPTLVNAMHHWAKGGTFHEVCDKTDMFEGTIVRIAARLFELLAEMEAAARTMGDETLEKKFVDAAACIKRGIMFANSLYLE